MTRKILLILYLCFSVVTARAQTEWGFDTDYDGWAMNNSLTGNVESGILTLNVTGNDPFMHSPNNLAIDANTAKVLRINAKNNTDQSKMQFYWITEQDQIWNETKRIVIDVTPGSKFFKEYIFDFSSVSEWQGTIKQIRFDPANPPVGNTFLIDYIGLSNDSYAMVKDSLQAESIIPVYVNRSNATFVFKSMAATVQNIEMSFKEQYTGTVPAAPVTLQLNPSETKFFNINISDWEDGEYETKVNLQNYPGNFLVRGIRKQTKIESINQEEVSNVQGKHLIFPDDYHLLEMHCLEHKAHQAELIKIAPWEQHTSYDRWRNSIVALRFNTDGSFTVRIDGRYVSSDMDTRILYYAKTNNFTDWEIVSSGPTAGAGSNLVTPTSYRFYDANTDGTVNLNEVRIIKTGTGTNPMLGNIPVPRRSMFAVWHKPNAEGVILQQTPITEDKSIFNDEEIGEWTDTNDNFGAERLYDEGQTLRFYQARLIPVNDPLRFHYDNVLASRVMVIWSSNDGINWTPEYFNPPTPDDIPGRQDYGVDIFNAGLNLEIGYQRIYDQEAQKVFTEVVYSRDGKKWGRLGNSSFLANSPTFGDWNFGYAMTTGNRTRIEQNGYYYEPMMGINVLHFMFLVSQNVANRNNITINTFNNFLGGRLMGDRGFESSSSWSFYNSWNNVIDHTRNQRITSGLVKYRKDGWISLRTQGQNYGAFTTKIFSQATSLTINAKTENDGFVRIEVLDSNGKEIPNYCDDNAAVFTGDSVQHNISWKNGTINTLPQGNFKLRLYMSKADLYAMYF